jgi:hypothetical protein
MMEAKMELLRLIILLAVIVVLARLTPHVLSLLDWIFDKRKRTMCASSSVWVIMCDERKEPAIVEMADAAGAGVLDCSCWRENSECRKSCHGHVVGSEQVRLLTE